jgi:uncharacterized membrane protein YeaQ/YmgE (transglycosylase-associated protein family)
MFTLLSWVVFGLIAGSIAEYLFPLKNKTGRWQTVCVGMAGSVLGGAAESILNGDGYRPAGFLISVVGAIACIWIWQQFDTKVTK